MATISYPTMTGITYHQDNEVYIKADNASVWTYCSGRSYTCVSYTGEKQRFSNDGALTYGYYGPVTRVIDSTGGTHTSDEWTIEFGFSQIVKELVIS